MVLYVNGLPIFTFEWKNPWTYQTARYNGQKQYKEDRNPKDKLLNFGRCLAHFTGDKNEIFFTTKLAGKETYFMPFNKGLPNGQGAGNPVNPNGYKTSYLWEWVLQKDCLADIIDKYVCFDYGEAKTGKTVPHIMKNAKKLIFPRYHQLDVVTKLLEDVSEKGVANVTSSSTRQVRARATRSHGSPYKLLTPVQPPWQLSEPKAWKKNSSTQPSL